MEVTVSLSLDTDNPIERSLVEVIRSIPKPSRHVSLVTALTLGFAFSSRSISPLSCSTVSEHRSDIPYPHRPEQSLDELLFSEESSCSDDSSISSEQTSFSQEQVSSQGIHDYLQSFQC